MSRRHATSVWLLLLLATCPVRAQTVVESANGTSSVVLSKSGVLLVNFADKSAKLGFTEVVSTKPFRLGAELKVKAATDFAQLFGKDAKPEGQARLFAGWLWEDTAGSHPAIPAQWVTFEFAHTRARYSLATTGGATGVSRIDSSFSGTTVTGYYNASLRNLILPGDMLFGVSAGFGRRNNYDSDTLSKVTVCQIVGTTAGASPTTASKCKDAKVGPYVEGNKLAGAYDVIWFSPRLKNRVALDVFGRYSAIRTGSEFTPGVGLFVPQPGAPLVFIGGFTLEWTGGRTPVAGFQLGIPF